MIELPVFPADGIVAVTAQRTQRTGVRIHVSMAVDTATIERCKNQPVVALFTGRIAVQPDQGKTGEIMVKGQILGKALLPVTLVTLQQSPTVRVDPLMTAPAVFRQRIRERACVAALAADFGMRVLQYKPGFGSMIEADVPGSLAMTICTVAAVTAEMHIVAGVTALTVIRQFRKSLRCSGHVAVGAGELRMGTLQSKTGFRQMIEAGIPAV